MDPKQILKQMIQFNKAAFNNTFDAVTVLQEQTEKLIATYLDQAPFLPTEGKKAITDWMKAYKKGRIEFKTAMDDNLKKIEEFFTGYDKAAKQQTIAKPEAVKAGPVEKAAKKIRVAKAKTAIKPRKKPGPKEVTNIDKVIGLIQASAKGISATELKKKTGLAETQILNIVNNATKAGRVRKIRRGVYGAA